MEMFDRERCGNLFVGLYSIDYPNKHIHLNTNQACLGSMTEKNKKEIKLLLEEVEELKEESKGVRQELKNLFFL